MKRHSHRKHTKIHPKASAEKLAQMPEIILLINNVCTWARERQTRSAKKTKLQGPFTKSHRQHTAGTPAAPRQQPRRALARVLGHNRNNLCDCRNKTQKRQTQAQNMTTLTNETHLDTQQAACALRSSNFGHFRKPKFAGKITIHRQLHTKS